MVLLIGRLIPKTISKHGNVYVGLLLVDGAIILTKLPGPECFTYGSSETGVVVEEHPTKKDYRINNGFIQSDHKLYGIPGRRVTIRRGYYGGLIIKYEINPKDLRVRENIKSLTDELSGCIPSLN